MADEQAKPAAGPMRIEADLVRELAELLDTNGLTEIEVEDGDRKIRVRRDAAMTAFAPVAAASPLAPEYSAAPVAAAPSPATAGETVRSPMVGTVFLSAEPGGAAFIALGDTVKAGDTLMIIEAMKVMNPILAAKAGTVRQLLVADAQPVEFDQPLAVID